MREIDISNQSRVETEEVSYLASNVFRSNTGEFIVVRRIERRLPGFEKKWIGLDAGALLRLICKKTGKTTGQVYVEAKEWEKRHQYEPRFPELKYLDLGMELGVFRWLSEEERGRLDVALQLSPEDRKKVDLEIIEV